MTTELEQLEDLIKHPGWALWIAFYEQEWGAAGFAGKVASALYGDMPSEAKVKILEQATVAQKACMGLRAWPEQRIAKLRMQAREANALPVMSRRGGL